MTTGADGLYYHLGTRNLVLDVALQNTEPNRKTSYAYIAVCLCEGGRTALCNIAEPSHGISANNLT